jgi:hypothetical protein
MASSPQSQPVVDGPLSCLWPLVRGHSVSSHANVQCLCKHKELITCFASLGVIPCAVVVLALDVFGNVLTPILSLSSGELCVIGEGLLILLDAALQLAYQAIVTPSSTPPYRARAVQLQLV